MTQKGYQRVEEESQRFENLRRDFRDYTIGVISGLKALTQLCGQVKKDPEVRRPLIESLRERNTELEGMLRKPVQYPN